MCTVTSTIIATEYLGPVFFRQRVTGKNFHSQGSTVFATIRLPVALTLPVILAFSDIFYPCVWIFMILPCQ